mmetsp:Transcript_99250/g.256592  ORF Transcript_99250/g.256592 Transcript_99250/m.256592 type:complete len:206 (+) Transcript_99250:696-1313(+)
MVHVPFRATRLRASAWTFSSTAASCLSHSILLPVFSHTTLFSVMLVATQPFKHSKPSCIFNSVGGRRSKVHAPSATVQVMPSEFFQTPLSTSISVGMSSLCQAMERPLLAHLTVFAVMAAAAHPFKVRKPSCIFSSVAPLTLNVHSPLATVHVMPSVFFHTPLMAATSLACAKRVHSVVFPAFCHFTASALQAVATQPFSNSCPS